MHSVRRLLAIVILVPIAILIVVLAVANRHGATVVLDPFNPAQPAAAFTLPLYLLLFATLILGVLIGGIASWLHQHRHRREERRLRAELSRRERETEDLRRRLAEVRPVSGESSSRALVPRAA